MDNPCGICKIINNLEEPKMEPVATSRYFLAVISQDGENKRMLIIPKKPVRSIPEYIQDKDSLIYQDYEDLTSRILDYIKREGLIEWYCTIGVMQMPCSESGMHECVLVIFSRQ